MQFLYIPAYGKEVGLSKHQIAWILSITGVVDIISRIIAAVVNNLKLLKTECFVAIPLLLTAITNMICLAFPGFVAVVASSVLLGFLGGLYVALYPVALVDLLGLELFPKAFALTVTIIGLFILPMPSIFGKV